MIQRDAGTEAFVGGTLVGSFEEGQQFERNAILSQLAEDPKCHLTRLAEAFDMTSERLRHLRGQSRAPVDRQPATTAAFLRDVSRFNLTLPSDPMRRKLRFRPQVA